MPILHDAEVGEMAKYRRKCRKCRKYFIGFPLGHGISRICWECYPYKKQYIEKYLKGRVMFKKLPI